MRLATITLYFDPSSYRAETGERLSKRELDEIGRQINEDTAPYYGYQGWSTKFVNVPAPRGTDAAR